MTFCRYRKGLGANKKTTPAHAGVVKDFQKHRNRAYSLSKRIS